MYLSTLGNRTNTFDFCQVIMTLFYFLKEFAIPLVSFFLKICKTFGGDVNIAPGVDSILCLSTVNQTLLPLIGVYNESGSGTNNSSGYNLLDRLLCTFIFICPNLTQGPRTNNPFNQNGHSTVLGILQIPHVHNHRLHNSYTMVCNL
jgi:hypothetical protein